MKILHIVNTVYQGGIRSLLYDMTKYQVENGQEVSILCIINDEFYLQNSEDFKKNGVMIFKGEYKNSYNPLNIFTIRKYIKGFDLIHVHQFPNQLYTKIAQILLRADKKPIFITTEHSTYNNRRKYYPFKWIDRWFYKTYDKIVSISKPTEKNMKDWLASKSLENKIVTITNGINISKFSKAENLLPQILDSKYNDTTKYIVMVARMDYPKDPLTLLKSIIYCPENTNIIFVGDGEYCNLIKKEANNMGVAERIHVLGNRSDIPQILKGSHVGVLSTKWDGFGLVAAEYMAAGLPVLVTDVEGVREVVDDQDALFPYNDEIILGEKITKLLTDKKYYEEKKNHSLNQSKLFSISKMNKKYLDLYNSL